MAWKKHNDEGKVVQAKTEDLVLATSYTEAESIAMLLIEHDSRDSISSDIIYEIIKTKVSTLLINDTLTKDTELVGNLVHCYFEELEETGKGLYAVKADIFTVDERTAKTKVQKTVIYVPATSPTNAAKLAVEHFKMEDVVIRDINFDKAQAILLPTDTYQQQITQ